jgi:hypothetical protein
LRSINGFMAGNNCIDKKKKFILLKKIKYEKRGDGLLLQGGQRPQQRGRLARPTQTKGSPRLFTNYLQAILNKNSKMKNKNKKVKELKVSFRNSKV